ncbi:MAG TPA: aminotransferase class I/II-fold pyridoxal phosphate-dependent enzyme [Terriglobia bacterium]|nr:aminotransferase class I/II-fold pyridoxal phosphate-dependent enzyme [Terriglobia bacterium]
MGLARKVTPLPALLVAQRVENVRYAIRDIAVVAEQLARDGKQIISLNIGDPLMFDFQTPPHLIQAVTRAMRDGKNGYAPSLGVEEALEAIRAEADRKGIRNIRTVFVTHAVSEAADICLTALVNPGENVLIPCPDYPLYSAVLAKLEAEVNFYRLDEAQEWQPDLDHLATKINPKTRAIVLINPNNPTGAVYSRKTLESIADLARRNGLVIITDEIYDKLILDGDPHCAIAALAPDLPIVTLHGLSKAYLAPGWRMGWAVVSGPAKATEPYIDNLHKLLRARLSANNPLQYAIRPALEGPQAHLKKVVEKLRRRRDLTMQWCASNPRVSCVKPRGAFYAFPRFEVSGSDEQFAKDLLAEKQVLIVHGTGFGMPSDAANYFRLVFLANEEMLRQAYQSISEMLAGRSA